MTEQQPAEAIPSRCDGHAELFLDHEDVVGIDAATKGMGCKKTRWFVGLAGRRLVKPVGGLPRPGPLLPWEASSAKWLFLARNSGGDLEKVLELHRGRPVKPAC
ncbi:hypothetical protein ABIB49_003549 [Arthrobacter sp. UYCu512]|uniref:hypothetical protein n=1 Tax=Arthrobacter sp. UYCu512 TaxID=3156338 RepID=UPI0033925A72